MKNSRRNWIVVIVVAIATIANVLGSLRSGNSQQSSGQTAKTQSTPPQKQQNRAESESQFPVADFDAREPDNLEERQKRKAKNKRYDNGLLAVSKNPRPEYTGTTVFDEKPLPPAIPTEESKVIIIGEVLNAKAHLSNNKGSVYSEFTIRVEEALKSDDSNNIALGNSVTVDRPGGFVRYRNGQKLLYRVAGKGLPQIGERYVLFLTNPDQSPNYKILTGYELKGDKVYPLDEGSRFEEFKGMGEMDFIKTIREALAQPSQKVNNQ